MFLCDSLGCSGKPKYHLMLIHFFNHFITTLRVFIIIKVSISPVHEISSRVRPDPRCVALFHHTWDLPWHHAYKHLPKIIVFLQSMVWWSWKYFDIIFETSHLILSDVPICNILIIQYITWFGKFMQIKTKITINACHYPRDLQPIFLSDVTSIFLSLHALK